MKPENSLLRPRGTTLLGFGMLAVASLVVAAPALGAAPDPSPSAGLYRPDPYRSPHTTPAPRSEPVRPVSPIRVVPLPVRAPVVVAHPVRVHHAKTKHVSHRKHVVQRRPVVHLAPAFVTPVHAPPELATVAAALQEASRAYRAPMTVVLALAALVGLSALFLVGATRVATR